MKNLRLAFLVSGLLMSFATMSWSSWPPCAYGEPYKSITYYSYKGGPQCGFRYVYCYASTPPYQEGCQTGYFDEWYNSCHCP